MGSQPVTVGTRAPDFAVLCAPVPGGTRQQVALGDYRDRWLVLVFYPRDFSLVCPTELTALSAHIDEFRTRECDVLGVSTDSIETHRRWIASPRAQGGVAGLNFPLASDSDGAMCRAYGVYVPRQHLALRGLFIIDPNGVLQYQVVHNVSVGRRADEVLRVLDALQTGGLCPEGWSSGDKPLDPIGSLGIDSVVGQYRIGAILGDGAFGRVFRAQDVVLERTVALKVIRPDAATPPDALLNEARAAAALVHPNVCTVFAVDGSEGVPMIVMEYVEGKPLSTMLQTAPLGVAQALSIGRQVARGMAAAHARGIVHGDLKPANVMVTPEGTAKIMDFGLARRRSEQGTELTAVWGPAGPSGISGTPSYMSPEQSHGEPLAAASDVFSLGLILYEMVTGRKAIAGANILEVLRSIDAFDPARCAHEVGEPFGMVLRRALVTDPLRRSIDMAEIETLLA